jgi:hypothetical protein
MLYDVNCTDVTHVCILTSGLVVIVATLVAVVGLCTALLSLIYYISNRRRAREEA